MKGIFQAIAKDKSADIVHAVYRVIAKMARPYELDVDFSNLQTVDGPVIFACNHSNSHDFYTVQEIFKNNVSMLVGSDDIDGLTYLLFSIANSIMVNRDDAGSRKKSVHTMESLLQRGHSILLFPESTWNVHPAKILLPMRYGVIRIAAETGRPVIPMIMEYVENDQCVKREREMIKKCIIRFGTPVFVSREDRYDIKLDEVREQMATIRWSVWESQGVSERNPADESVFTNHEYLKMYDGMFGFKYDWEKEEKFIFGNEDYIYSSCPLNKVNYHQAFEKMTEETE